MGLFSKNTSLPEINIHQEILAAGCTEISESQSDVTAKEVMKFSEYFAGAPRVKVHSVKFYNYGPSLGIYSHMISHNIQMMYISFIVNKTHYDTNIAVSTDKGALNYLVEPEEVEILNYPELSFYKEKGKHLVLDTFAKSVMGFLSDYTKEWRDRNPDPRDEINKTNLLPQIVKDRMLESGYSPPITYFEDKEFNKSSLVFEFTEGENIKPDLSQSTINKILEVLYS